MPMLSESDRYREIEISRAFERQAALANVALVLGGIEFDRHLFIVYTISLEAIAI
jgi:hypothetical protein